MPASGTRSKEDQEMEKTQTLLSSREEEAVRRAFAAFDLE